MSKSQLEV